MDLEAMQADDLVRLARDAETSRREALDLTGRALAVLHDRHGLSWPTIERLTGIPSSTAHRRARDHLRVEADDDGRRSGDEAQG
ncbi:hypothetical protein ACQEVB_19115 [Pseudonocardia sp. CA-107938]|uniref:hypothetical protein n=1 Tax=Pseudonocardia sp. CA-107938 TaxID=3240021 RepID=UPI003D94424C